ncbi:MAG: DUF3553 domain-containing protein [Anaerolineae bacterium]|nr:DUF3553 domain-containing protein [Anaerolineae bacterium]
MNQKQKAAVTAPSGPVLVLAGPGSGKTRVLTHRIAYLVQQLGIAPFHILAVTFTNKAAQQMQVRVESMVGESMRGIWMGTFHSSCARILRREAAYLPFDSNYVILDSDDQIGIVKNILKEENINDKQFRPYTVHSDISNAKNNLVGPDELSVDTQREKVTQRVYQRYQQTLFANNALDFDDLLFWSVKLLNEHPAVRDAYARQFEHVLVDEFQDTNLVQYALLNHLASYHGNIFVVGDEDQSIYRWRGADYRNVLRFEKDYPNAKKILLEENYRSTQVILNAATQVINRNSNRTIKDLRAAREIEGNKIILHEAYDDRDEAVFVVDTIRRLMDHGNAKGSDFAVMYRTNAQSRLLEEAFLKSGLDYKLVGAQRFYGRLEIKDLIAYLRLIHNPADELSFSRIINTPKRGIGPKTLQDLLAAAHAANISPGELVLSLGLEGDKSEHWGHFASRNLNTLAFFGRQFAGWLDARNDLHLPELLDMVIEDIAYEQYLEENSSTRENATDRMANVHELRRLTYEYEEAGLEVFLENMALVSDQDTLPEAADAPTLLTLHAAKGLEFSTVFLVGLDQEILPHSRSLFEPEELAEERRLFYVGMTRAENQLYITRADRRSGYGSYSDCEPSEFLKDIPLECLEVAGRPGSTRHHHRAAGSSGGDWNQYVGPQRGASGINTGTRVFRVPGANRPETEKKYHPGMRVRHPSWGEGIVLDSRVYDEEETVDITFEDVGFKKVLASIVRLEILD